jgi:F-type H+-transporting ATPase subunit b
MLADLHFWVTLSFILFVLMFLKFGKGPLLAKLDAKIAEIKNEIATAESLRVEAQNLLAQYQSRQRDAAKEAQAIIDNARRHADEIRRNAEQDLKEAATRREQQLQDRLRRVEENALAEIRAYAAELAVKATREIIAEKMDDKTNARLVEQSVKQVAGQLG